MSKSLFRKLFWSVVLFAGLIAARPLNQNPAKWVNLFNGKNLEGWHTYNQKTVTGWTVENGLIASDGGTGDLTSDQEYGDFDLEFEFKIPPASNSGVLYKVIEREDIKRTVFSAPEYQIIDDIGYIVKGPNGERIPLKGTQLTGANYDMDPPKDPTAFKPAGEWNTGRIVVDRNNVKHFLNGKLVSNYEYGGTDWKEKVSLSKYKDWPYAEAHHKGKIALQNHNAKEKVWFRKIRIKELNL